MRQPGDIVVIVPRWIIVAVGLLILAVGLSLTFLLLMLEMIAEGIGFAVFALVLSLICWLVLYAVWRFYWYVLLLGLTLLSLALCAWMYGVSTATVRLSPFGQAERLFPSVFGTIDRLQYINPLNVPIAFGLGGAVSLILFLLYLNSRPIAEK